MLAYFHRHSHSESFNVIQSPSRDFNLLVRGETLRDDEVKGLVDSYQLDPNILEDMRDRAELARVEYSDSRTYVFMRAARRTRKGSIITTPLLAVIDPKHFFILSRFDNVPIQSKIESGVVVHGEQNTAIFLGVVAALVAEYDEMTGHTSRVIRDTSQRLKTHEVTNQDFIHFVTVEDNLNEYDMNLSGMLAVMKRLRDNDRILFNRSDTEALDDIVLHIEQLLVGVSTHSRRVKSIRDAHTTIANNNLNARIKALTALTVLITLPNVVFGMYGMNVALPFADATWAYAAIAVVTITIIFIVYTVARKLKVF